MGILDTPLRAVAKTLIPKFGTPASIERQGAYDEGTDSVGVATSYSCNVVFEQFTVGMTDGEIVKSGDQIALIPASELSITPNAETDRLKVGTESWQVVRNLPIQPGDTEIVHRLQVRR